MFILDLAHDLFQDVLQRDEPQNPAAFLAHQGHGTVGLEKQFECRGHVGDARPTDGVAAMALLLGALLVFSVWLPAPLLELLHQAAAIIGGKS